MNFPNDAFDRSGCTRDDVISIMIGLGRIRLLPAKEGTSAEDMARHDEIEYTFMDWLRNEYECSNATYLESVSEKSPPYVIAESLAAFNKVKSQIEDTKEVVPYIDEEIAKIAIGKPSALRIDPQLQNKDGERLYSYLSVKEFEIKLRHKIAEINSSSRAAKFPLQQQAILAELQKLDQNPLLLPVPDPGKAGMQAEIRNVLVGTDLFSTKKAFDRAWDKMLEKGILAQAV